MRKKITRYGLAAILVLVIATLGCTSVTFLDQPSSVFDGEQFQVTVTAEYEAIDGDEVCYAMLYIHLPEQFSVEGGTFAANANGSPIGSGTLEVEDLWQGENPYEYSEAGYEWSGWKTENVTTEDNTIYEVTYVFDITANAAKGEDYEMSYCAGVYKYGYAGQSFWGMHGDQIWFNPITVEPSGIKSVSFGTIKANFK